MRGWQRAGALVAFFAAPAHKKIATPKTIIAATVCDDPEVEPADARSLRPALTVEPLVAKLGAAATYINDIPVGQEAAAIDAIKACSGVVLVAWEHKRIPKIAAGFVDAPPEWGDRFIRLDPRSQAQRLLRAHDQVSRLCWPAIFPIRAAPQCTRGPRPCSIPRSATR